ncbi:MAG: polyprenyl synthetase family protein [Simkaniaceae bacterium]|nr:polyprenyl synthetase family protein [Candidatus Sacchlamyda saccharinae]
MHHLKASIDQTLLQLFSNENDPLCQAALYSLEGGKRLRPLLCLAVLDLYDVEIEKGLYPAAALEMIHTYSLIHDDLPCMDDDDERRGKPSLHRAYSESLAVLTGDFLLTYGFETLANSRDLTDAEKVALTKTLATRSGAQGMIGGQVLDLEENSHGWQEMALKKTGALFSTALEFGAILAGVETHIFKGLGEHLGLAYQLLDDLSDGDGASLIFGQEILVEKVEELARESSAILDTLPSKEGKLQILAGEIFKQQAVSS